jgi:endogenous inhibitor of DNA gyrase (YacG/DUF329 family)
MNHPSPKEQNPLILKVINLRKQRTCYTLQQIGNKFGHSKEWARQILQSNGMPTKHIKMPRLCSSCGKPITKNKTGLCFKCWANSHRITATCKECGKKFQKKESEIFRNELDFCSNKCKGKYIGREYGWGAHSPKKHKERK